jgi:hypothetical protein
VVGNGEEERMSVMQEAVPPPRRGLDRAGLRVVLIASLGGALEFYDFIVFGTFAAYISRAFFPASDPLVSLLSTFASSPWAIFRGLWAGCYSAGEETGRADARASCCR